MDCWRADDRGGFHWAGPGGARTIRYSCKLIFGMLPYADFDWHISYQKPNLRPILSSVVGQWTKTLFHHKIFINRSKEKKKNKKSFKTCRCWQKRLDQTIFSSMEEICWNRWQKSFGNTIVFERETNPKCLLWKKNTHKTQSKVLLHSCKILIIMSPKCSSHMDYLSVMITYRFLN